MATVETERLLLRPFERSDIRAYTAIRAKPRVIRYLPGGPERAAQAPIVAEQTVVAFGELWKHWPNYGPWAVIEKETSQLVGHAGLRLLPDLGGETEVLYMLDDSVWGKGYATEAGTAARDFGFGTLGLSRLIAMALPRNARSIRVMEKIGMAREPDLVDVFGVLAVRYVLERYSEVKGVAPTSG